MQQELGPRVCPFVRDSCLATSFACHEGMGGTPPTGSACSSVPLLCGEQFTTGLGGCQGQCRPLGPVASGVCISRFPSPFSPTTKLHPHMEETVQAHPPLLGSPKRKAVNHCHHTPLLGHVPSFYFSLFCIIIIGLISKENKSIFTRERRHPQKAKIMTVCSLQETLIKLDLPSVQASASFQEELWCEAERRGSPFQATCGQQRD